MKHTLLTWTRLVLGSVLAVLLVSLAGKGDLEDAYIRDAMEKEIRPQRVIRSELLCGCLPIHRGRWLRFGVTHQRDMEFCNAICVYEGGETTEGVIGRL